jgi:hypothetical protein
VQKAKFPDIEEMLSLHLSFHLYEAVVLCGVQRNVPAEDLEIVKDIRIQDFSVQVVVGCRNFINRTSL